MHAWWLDPNGDDGMRAAASAARRDLPGALDLARALGEKLSPADPGSLLTTWDALARAASVDLTVTRAVEPHLDALAILAQAGVSAPADATLGVYAAEGPGGRLRGEQAADGWRLTGPKPWCSLASELSHALVTAWVDDERRGLFLIDLRQPGVRIDDAPWVSSGLSLIRSSGITLDDVPAVPVGEPQWYLARPGFAWGGIGVAAIWYGAAVGIALRLREAVIAGRQDDVTLMHLGACDSALLGARGALRQAAADIARDAVARDAAWPYALRVRDVCARAAEDVIRHADHAMGPGPLTSDEPYARLVDDLRVYVRQHHAERDQVALGRALLGPSG
ncbi:acyl-CoA dehydrogenase family protein [Cumulibacter manganitolerans]|uniref:acyl-CoA dehydrogenase n=1 Tax=Cumulibacter manganitolerans TaxID=1884992 RepID=UPI001296BF7A|nr:acyl-CoA dehydrogenase [Cumulibacter manganitolerans]